MDPVEKTSPSVYEHLTYVLDHFASVAWQKLGLQPDMVTGKIEGNLAEARVAIDVVASLVGFLEPQLESEDRRQIQNLIRDLRMNYVNKSQEGTS